MLCEGQVCTQSTKSLSVPNPAKRKKGKKISCFARALSQSPQIYGVNFFFFFSVSVSERPLSKCR